MRMSCVDTAVDYLSKITMMPLFVLEMFMQLASRIPRETMQ